jgi:hypothetical protein
VSFHPGLRAVLPAALIATQLFSQSFDPVKQAAGWARVDKDGSIAFYDKATKKIYSWMRDGGIVSTVDVSGLEQPPEKWVLDFSSNAWVVSGKNLIYVDKSGKNFTMKLPYEVGDLAWDTRGFFLSYKTPEPFIEMRGYDSGNVTWYIRNRAMKGENAPVTLHRILINEDRTLFLGSRGDLQMQQVDTTNGRIKGGTALVFNGGLPPSLALGNQERGPIAWVLGRNMAIHAVPASQVPSFQQSGMLLAVENLSNTTVQFLSTGLSEQHSFIGMIDSDAVFIAPGGGLVFVPLKLAAQ